MISQIMAYIKNHFWYSMERETFKYTTTGIEGDFDNTYVVGQYIHVVGSFLNDGVYKLTAVTDTVLTVDATLQEEETDEYSTIYGCKVTNDFLSIVADIESWSSDNSGKEGVASESIDSYSISFNSDAQGNGWQSAFRGRLAPYKQVYEVFNYGNSRLL